MTPPRFNEAKISPVACKYTCIKNKAAFVLKLYYSCHVCLNIEQSAIFGMLKYGARMATGVKRQLRLLCIDDINIDDIRSGWLLSVLDES